MIWLILILPSVARLIEALRDAEAFQRPTEDRSDTWHYAKILQFFCWAWFGAVVILTESGVIWGMVALLPAYFVFERSLKFFRKRT